MKIPTEILKEEHKIIKKGLDILEFLDIKKNENKKIAVGLLEFFSQFADKCHHAKEENLLFPLMIEKGVPKDGGPIGVMLFEHNEGRKLRDSMLKNIYNPERFRKYALDFIVLLKQHIDKEENILYPMADSIFNSQDKNGLIEKFEETEKELGEDLHRKYTNLIETLTKRFNI